MIRWWLKRCSKCGGDLYEENGSHGRYIQCFQCGRVLSDLEEMSLRRPSFAEMNVGLRREAFAARTRSLARREDRSSEEDESVSREAA
jgi:hypothetical protein